MGANMNEPIDELISYADHTQDCMVAVGHDERTCGYDDAEGKAQAAWEALKAENERLTRERDEAFRMSRCECGPDECCANLVKLHEENARLRDALVNLLDNSPVEYDFHGKYLDKEQGKAIEAARAALSPQETTK